MNWQEYQEAVSEFYTQAEGIGVVQKDKTLPDKITGQPRQIDCWIEAKIKGHSIRVLVDAKFHKGKLNTNHVDGVFALAEAVGMDKAIMVCPNGWTEPAAVRARFFRMDFKLWPAQDASAFMDPDRWMQCPECEGGFIIMDNDGFSVSSGIITWWLAGQCHKCKGGVVWCQACGEQFSMPYGKTQWCGCRHMWRFSKKRLSVYLNPKHM